MGLARFAYCLPVLIGGFVLWGRRMAPTVAIEPTTKSQIGNMLRPGIASAISPGRSGHFRPSRIEARRSQHQCPIEPVAQRPAKRTKHPRSQQQRTPPPSASCRRSWRDVKFVRCEVKLHMSSPLIELQFWAAAFRLAMSALRQFILGARPKYPSTVSMRVRSQIRSLGSTPRRLTVQRPPIGRRQLSISPLRRRTVAREQLLRQRS